MLEKITAVLREHTGNDDLAVSQASTFEELELDSLDTVELVITLEEEFGVTIEMNENIKTVGDLMGVIKAAGN